ncbi:MAG: ArsR family transcriptional regulator [Candidatus Rokubacteria bacterium]|nr:ArsR family transcriptional regulator [Candidatus Rokubacteria bacterium]
MPDVERIDAHAARREVTAGRAWLVCAYEDRQRCRSMMLDGAIDMDHLEGLLPTARKDQPMVFYCA